MKDNSHRPKHHISHPGRATSLLHLLWDPLTDPVSLLQLPVVQRGMFWWTPSGLPTCKVRLTLAFNEFIPLSPLLWWHHSCTLSLLLTLVQHHYFTRAWITKRVTAAQRAGTATVDRCVCLLVNIGEWKCVIYNTVLTIYYKTPPLKIMLNNTHKNKQKVATCSTSRGWPQGVAGVLL